MVVEDEASKVRQIIANIAGGATLYFTVDRDEYGRAEVHITYRFGPPPEESASFVDGVRNSRESWWVGIEAERADGEPKMARDRVQLATAHDGE